LFTHLATLQLPSPQQRIEIVQANPEPAGGLNRAEFRFLHLSISSLTDVIVLLTLLGMSRGQYDAVTNVPVLIPCTTEEQDGVATFLREGAVPMPVRSVTDVDFRSSSKRHKEALSEMWDYEREQFIAVLDLLRALPSRDKLAVTRARQHVSRALSLKRDSDRGTGITPSREDDLAFGEAIIPLFGLRPGREKEAIERWSGYRHGPKAEADEKWLLSQLVSEAMESAQLVLWWSGKRFRPALYCPNNKTAIYAFLLMKAAAGTGWGVCPKCGSFFEKKRSDQNYCSIAHREAHRVARWRAQQQSKTKKKGGKNVTHKTR
jgi:hypothetical protein